MKKINKYHQKERRKVLTQNSHETFYKYIFSSGDKSQFSISNKKDRYRIREELNIFHANNSFIHDLIR